MNETLHTEREKALAKYLDCEPSEAERFIANEDYKVLTVSEADEACEEYIRETLWAFSTRFLQHYLSVDFDAELLKPLQEQSCEGCNELIYALVKDRFNDLCYDAIASDGRGHFLATYDGEENECDDYLIYRCN